MKKLLRFVLTIGFALLAHVAVAAPPQTINYQGDLTNAGGTPINAPVMMTFRLYNADKDGSALYTEIQNPINVSNGSFNAVIGAVTPITLPFDVPYWLTVAVNGDPEMGPRQPLASSPYAFRAATADTATTAGTISGTITGSQVTGAITTATIPGSQITGTIGTTQIASNAVTQAKLSPVSGAAAGKVLGTDGSNLQWQTASAGTVTSVGTGSGLTGGPITGSGTISLATTQLLPAIACATNQIVKWNGTAWACTNAPSLPTLYTGFIITGTPVVLTSFNDRSTWQVMGVVTPPAGNYYIIARVNGQTESTSGTGAYSTSMSCELLLEPTVPRPRLDWVDFTAPLGLGGSIQKLVMASYVTILAGGSVSVRCRTAGREPIPVSTSIGAGGHIDAIPVGGQVIG